MTERTGRVLRIERTFDAPIQDVFDAWTSEEVLLRWWHAEHHWETTTAEVDLRVGGSVRLVMRDTDEGTDYGGGGEYTVVEPPHRLAFTWVWDHEPSDPQLVEVELSDQGDTTKVVLTNSGLTSEKSRDEHEEGWQNSFDNLDRALASRERPRRRP
jgi:uncharacterized protein YndB with AHSA1/START domain